MRASGWVWTSSTPGSYGLLHHPSSTTHSTSFRRLSSSARTRTFLLLAKAPASCGASPRPVSLIPHHGNDQDGYCVPDGVTAIVPLVSDPLYTTTAEQERGYYTQLLLLSGLGITLMVMSSALDTPLSPIDLVTISVMMILPIAQSRASNLATLARWTGGRSDRPNAAEAMGALGHALMSGWHQSLYGWVGGPLLNLLCAPGAAGPLLIPVVGAWAIQTYAVYRQYGLL